mmetsp:Transcript_44420/g.129153  ORF Transcript_44420/g.129153 Transcript_44420/m.129153 type:complete len:321 (-) Transcript_44420:527-1489(-)
MGAPLAAEGRAGPASGRAAGDLPVRAGGNGGVPLDGGRQSCPSAPGPQRPAEAAPCRSPFRELGNEIPVIPVAPPGGVLYDSGCKPCKRPTEKASSRMHFESLLDGDSGDYFYDDDDRASYTSQAGTPPEGAMCHLFFGDDDGLAFKYSVAHGRLPSIAMPARMPPARQDNSYVPSRQAYSGGRWKCGDDDDDSDGELDAGPAVNPVIADKNTGGDPPRSVVSGNLTTASEGQGQPEAWSQVPPAPRPSQATVAPVALRWFRRALARPPAAQRSGRPTPSAKRWLAGRKFFMMRGRHCKRAAVVPVEEALVAVCSRESRR